MRTADHVSAMLVSARRARRRAREQSAWSRHHARRAVAARENAERAMRRVDALVRRMTTLMEADGDARTACGSMVRRKATLTESSGV